MSVCDIVSRRSVKNEVRAPDLCSGDFLKAITYLSKGPMYIFKRYKNTMFSSKCFIGCR